MSPSSFQQEVQGRRSSSPFDVIPSWPDCPRCGDLTDRQMKLLSLNGALRAAESLVLEVLSEAEGPAPLGAPDLFEQIRWLHALMIQVQGVCLSFAFRGGES